MPWFRASLRKHTRSSAPICGLTRNRRLRTPCSASLPLVLTLVPGPPALSGATEMRRRMARLCGGAHLLGSLKVRGRLRRDGCSEGAQGGPLNTSVGAAAVGFAAAAIVCYAPLVVLGRNWCARGTAQLASFCGLLTPSPCAPSLCHVSQNTPNAGNKESTKSG